MASDYRVGQGFDIHRLHRGRKLLLGGVEIPHPTGLVGHSDGDALLHALVNALLGAVGRGDIGLHFPDTDPRYKGIASALLVEKVVAMVRRSGFRVVNVDATILAERPRLALFFGAMRKKMAALLGVGEERVNLKAGTLEGLGELGRGKGIAATVVILLRKVERFG
jgi:2-C-methyl-D-erythritol 2,4-cyclodiphosphate synthase